MAIRRYKTRSGEVRWRIDTYLELPDGVRRRIQRRNLPSKALAGAFLTRVRSEAFIGRHFPEQSSAVVTVEQVWDLYKPITERDNKSGKDDCSRVLPILKHLGNKMVPTLTVAVIDRYRATRACENTRFKRPPAPSTVDRETELLKRMLNYAVKAGVLSANPIAHVRLLNRGNTRRIVISEAEFTSLLNAAAKHLRPILLVAFDTGMRKGEILGLRWDQVNLEDRVVSLAPEETKTRQPRVVVLTNRVQQALSELSESSIYLFAHPITGKAMRTVRRSFRTACKKAKLGGLWFHDLRRSFVTRARRKGIPESVIMRMSGHKTRNVFERYNIVSVVDLRRAVKRLEEP